MIQPFWQRRILFVGGKGGVGKTTVASAVALHSADRGDRTLLVSTDPAPSTADILETTLSGEPRPITDRLAALEIDPAAEADRYIHEVKKRIAETTPPRLAQEVDRQIDVARVSPGAEDAALFDRFTRIIETEGAPYDRIIFDTAPTGHTLRLLTMPESMATWMSGLIARRRKVHVLSRMWRNVAGAAAGDVGDGSDPVMDALTERQHRFERARTILTDPSAVAFVFVLVPERLPILETQRAVTTLAKHGIPVGAVIVNRILPSDADGVFLARRREREAGYLARIEDEFAELRILRLPLMDRDVAGLDALREIASHLPID